MAAPVPSHSGQRPEQTGIFAGQPNQNQYPNQNLDVKGPGGLVGPGAHGGPGALGGGNGPK